MGGRLKKANILVIKSLEKAFSCSNFITFDIP
jgi:hypothetical protein